MNSAVYTLYIVQSLMLGTLELL